MRSLPEIVAMNAKSKAMRIRDSHATLNGDKTEHEMPSGGLEIIDTNGNALFCIRFDTPTSIYVTVRGVVKYGATKLDDSMRVMPQATNSIIIARIPYD